MNDLIIVFVFFTHRQTDQTHPYSYHTELSTISFPVLSVGVSSVVLLAGVLVLVVLVRGGGGGLGVSGRSGGGSSGD